MNDARNSWDDTDPDGSETGRVYQIKVRGALDDSWSDWFCNMSIVGAGTDQQSPVTILTGRVADQSVLRGILNRIWDLNLSLISVEPAEASSQDNLLQQWWSKNDGTDVKV